MSDEHKQYASTAAATLEAHILSVHSAKSEAEWWAQREIERLRAENEKLREQYSAGVAAWSPVYEIVLNERDTLKAENEKLRAALKMIAETYNKPTTSKDGLAFIAAAALKETGGD